ncbi:hypothetical protein QF038_001819 [Pseudarthrobacter sp. W1I19]|uniref:hypothetical protein n=1 Tax=Pseudarthrobacter sp. W1I19 TaxID=3042288 RepID=UPI0027880632|nr:hypothetical protein [Pseudarthrobacter sp. W1I19]MDQ0923311.1 hypothetical protein [Pseudarthrobacter sp. W1I19]
MSDINERGKDVAKLWDHPAVKQLPLTARASIEVALHSEFGRGMDAGFKQGRISGLRKARNLPRFTFRALGKHIMGYVSVAAIDAELGKLGVGLPLPEEGVING